MIRVMTHYPAPPSEQVHRDVERALAEDIGAGDATASLIDANSTASASVITRNNAVVCGRPWFDACFRVLDARMAIEWLVDDGTAISAGQQLCFLHGNTRALLSGERCALNFLQTLSATATVTAQHVAAIQGTRAVILDTRKTLPGLRVAQKYAVRCGGGANHRVGLFDAILIKENHIAAAGSLGAAVHSARAQHPRLSVEVEVETFDELDQALAAGVDRVMLDDFSIGDMRKAVVHVAGRVPLEASGGVGLDRLRQIAETGVDYISIGALTKHIRAIDLSMRILANAFSQIRPR